MKARTQKARGLQALELARFHVPAWTLYSESQADTIRARWRLPLFVRPCPVRPRHGFVESRLCNTWPEVDQVLQETRAADPDGEVVLMEPVQASWNAILTPRALVVGPGHDGATAGRECVSLPLAGLQFEPDLLAEAGLREGDTPYIEAVYGRKLPFDDHPAWWATQLRAGPEVAAAGDWVPRRVVVQKVLRADGDLLEWEATIASAGDGAVVWHPGGSPASHYAVHARIHGVPVLFGPEPPKIGDVLDPTLGAEPRPGDAAWDREFVRGARLGSRPGGSVRLVRRAIAAVHVIEPTGLVAARTLGWACAVLLRWLAAACDREAEYEGGGRPGPREETYDGFLARWGFGGAVSALRRAHRVFMVGRFASGYGGPSWARVARAALRLARALADRRPVEAVAAANRAVHEVHNYGPVGTKIAGDGLLDALARAEVNPQTLCVLLGLGLTARELAAAPVPRVSLRMPRSPEVRVQVRVLEGLTVRAQVAWRGGYKSVRFAAPAEFVRAVAAAVERGEVVRSCHPGSDVVYVPILVQDGRLVCGGVTMAVPEELSELLEV